MDFRPCYPLLKKKDLDAPCPNLEERASNKSMINKTV